MDRRGVLKLGAYGSAAYLGHRLGACDTAEAVPMPGTDEIYAKVYPGEWQPFTEEGLVAQARALSQAPHVAPPAIPSEAFKALDYDQYRSIRFRKDVAIWGKDDTQFNVELFHTGYIYQTPVDIFIVENQRVGKLGYDTSAFSFGPEIPPIPSGVNLGYSGFRIHGPVNRADKKDEFVVFQGASYFRAKAEKQDYGLSGRGLALNTAQPPSDEFPVFRTFWLQKPLPGEKFFILYALLDSASVTGTYKFVISSMHNTIMDVSCTLFPRQPLPHPGIAPLTSMFFFAPSNNLRVDEVRPRVHDSDGLSIQNGKGEHIWRPLINAKRIEFSVFADKGLKGFGLLQRERRADRFEDFDAKYDLRPSVWVEPKDEWGEGSVDLVELPTQNEYLDNIVAYWRPKEQLLPGKVHEFRYRLTWCFQPPIPQNVAIVSQTLVGASTQRSGRLFYVDFIGTEHLNLCDEDTENCSNRLANVELNVSSGTIVNAAFRKNKIAGGHRLGFEYLPQEGIIEADLRCALISGGKTVSEVWIYRWTA